MDCAGPRIHQRRSFVIHKQFPYFVTDSLETVHHLCFCCIIIAVDRYGILSVLKNWPSQHELLVSSVVKRHARKPSYIFRLIQEVELASSSIACHSVGILKLGMTRLPTKASGVAWSNDRYVRPLRPRKGDHGRVVSQNATLDTRPLLRRVPRRFDLKTFGVRPC